MVVLESQRTSFSETVDSTCPGRAEGDKPGGVSKHSASRDTQPVIQLKDI